MHNSTERPAPMCNSSKPFADGQHHLMNSARAPAVSHTLSPLTWKSWTLAGGSFWKSKVALAKVGSSLPHFCGGKITEVTLTISIIDPNVGCPPIGKSNNCSPHLLIWHSFSYWLGLSQHLTVGSGSSVFTHSLCLSAYTVLAVLWVAHTSAHTPNGFHPFCIYARCSLLGYAPPAFLEKSSFFSSILWEIFNDMENVYNIISMDSRGK